VLESLAPARRRFVLGVLLLVVVAIVVGVVAYVVSRPEPVDPVAQDTRGPVLLVPGYGGNTTRLEVLAAALRRDGRDAEVVPLDPPATQDLRVQAGVLDRAVDRALARTGAPSVDVIGYSAGGVVVRLWVAELGGGNVARRALTLASPHHGTDLASLASDVAPDSCPEACVQLAEGSDLLRELNAGDETPPGPAWIAIWTDDDRTVVPPDSGDLEGAVGFSVQSVCPGETISHGEVPSNPTVIAMVELELGTDTPQVPTGEVCVRRAAP
jgi:triacylglycerol lipase